MSKRSPEPRPVISFARLRNLSTEQLLEKLAGPPEETARWLEAAAKFGLVEAQTALGQILLDGRGLRQSKIAAVQWFEIAADAGYAPAINMLGRCCELGWGLPINLPRAADCYRCAAETGLDWGQYNYANMLLRGRGVIRDREAALALYRKAADQGHAKSINMVGRFIEEGWEVAPDARVAAIWYHRAAAAGDFRGQYNLASVLAANQAIGQAEAWLHRAMKSATADFLTLMAGRLSKSPEPRLRQVGAIAARLASGGSQF